MEHLQVRFLRDFRSKHTHEAFFPAGSETPLDRTSALALVDEGAVELVAPVSEPDQAPTPDPVDLLAQADQTGDDEPSMNVFQESSGAAAEETGAVGAESEPQIEQRPVLSVSTPPQAQSSRREQRGKRKRR